LLLASNNYSGINLHGGTGKSVANSVGGFLPGDVMLKEKGATAEQIASHPHPFYTPIATFDGNYSMQPVAFGLKFAGSFSGGTLFKSDFSAQIQAAGVDATAYAAKLADGRISVIVLNKDAEKELRLTVDFGSASSGSVESEALHAPALDSREARIESTRERSKLKQGRLAVTVRPASGLRLTLI
jgi:hypothetical protein